MAVASALERLRRLRSDPRRQMPFASLVPAIVVVFGLLAAVAIAAIGISELMHQNDRRAALRSELLATTLAERLNAAHAGSRELIIERAAVRSGAEVMLVHASGRVLIDGSASAPSEPGIAQLLVVGRGETQTSLGRTRFSSARLNAPWSDLAVITFVTAPKRPIAIDSLVSSVAAYTAILLAIAALVAFALSRDVHADVEYLSRRIRNMARSEADPAGASVPVRTIDDVGAMTHAFNELVQRFTEAESSYREDLRIAVSIERDKSAFLAALSHELKTPLNVILGFADVLLAEVEGPLSDEAKECLTTMRGSGLHLKALIKDILDLSALESGELTLARELTNVYVIATNVLAEHKVTALEKGVELRLSGETAVAWSDPLRVRQIVSNLVSNAVKFTQRGYVEVKVERRGEETAIIVNDTGPGIAIRDQQAIFEDFSQVGDIKARGAGTGLGLAITRRLVRMHGGKISLTSEIGKGASFTVLLPSVQRGRSRSKARISALPPAFPGGAQS
jgi:signal transduction histidine kinase